MGIAGFPEPAKPSIHCLQIGLQVGLQIGSQIGLQIDPLRRLVP